jgi:hypothetical protein
MNLLGYHRILALAQVNYQQQLQEVDDSHFRYEY